MMKGKSDEIKTLILALSKKDLIKCEDNHSKIDKILFFYWMSKACLLLVTYDSISKTIVILGHDIKEKSEE